MARLPAPFAAIVLAIAQLVGAAILVVAPGERTDAATLTVGSLALVSCGHDGGYCGSLERPLDPMGSVTGTISIGFEYYPRSTRGPSAGTLVATEGGPGYSARASREDYLALYAPLRTDHDVLIMDNRGTGSSGAVDCPSLQRPSSVLTLASVAECGRFLGPRAWTYGTAYAADDLAALLDALGLSQVDLYGDSYGTYMAQTFALRHPTRLRTLVLDGAYPLSGPDIAWSPTYAPAMRDRFRLVCQRSAACSALPGDALTHVQPALDRLRERPFDATATDQDGAPVRFRADAAALATLMFGGTPALASVRELDAAARAYAANDAVPLVRLLAEAHAGVAGDTGDVQVYSAGLAASVMCGDAPQIFDMTLAPSERLAERDRLIAARARAAPDTYAPFTWDEYRSIPLDYAFLDECVLWPAVSAERRSTLTTPKDAVYPGIPVLVLSGELDGMTTIADGRDAAAAFPHARQVVVANSFHVNALPRARSTCGARLVRAFIATRAVADDCSATPPPVRLVRVFARHASDVQPARAAPDTSASDAELRLAAVAVETVGDVVVRAAANSSGHAAGLRGGTYRITRRGRELHVVLDRVRWTEDVALSGAVRVNADSGRTEATVSVVGAGLRRHWRIGWNERDADPQASVTDTGATPHLRATTPAP